MDGKLNMTQERALDAAQEPNMSWAAPKPKVGSR